jgi:hypothetical protein
VCRDRMGPERIAKLDGGGRIARLVDRERISGFVDRKVNGQTEGLDLRRVFRGLQSRRVRCVRMLRKILIGVAVLVGLNVLAALGIGVRAWLSGNSQDLTGDILKSRGAAPPVVLPEGRRIYVALGDSYSAGEGVRPYLAGTGDPADGGDRCHRSTAAYALQIRFAEKVEVRFRACSGARIVHMLRTQPTKGGGNRLGPQLGQNVLGPDVGLVTVTIGGNDLGFSHVLRHCATHSSCMNDLFDDSFEHGRPSGLTLEAWASKELPILEDQLTRLYARLRRGAPNARIIVLGYPNLFWTDRAAVSVSDCILQLAIGRSETRFLLDLQHRLSVAMAEAAARARVEFVETATIFSGHEPCGDLTPRWIDFLPLRGRKPDPGAYHPNRNGQYILSRVVSCYLSQHPESAQTYDARALSSCVLNGAKG